ncbi:MAG: response regulator [Myxococcota bacterium]
MTVGEGEGERLKELDLPGRTTSQTFDRNLQRQLAKMLPIFAGLVSILGIVLTSHRWTLFAMTVGYVGGNALATRLVGKVSDRRAHYVNGLRVTLATVWVGVICYVVGPVTPMWLLSVISLLVPPILFQRISVIISLQVLAIVAPVLGLRLAGSHSDLLMVVTVSLLSIGVLLNGVGSFMVRSANALRDSVSELETEVDERRQAEARVIKLNEMLARSRDEARAASETKSEFLANMSHEIRTPMNAVIGMTELLLASKLDAEQRGFARIIRDSGHSLLALINSILDFSKLDAEQLELEVRSFDVRRCLESAVDVVSAVAADKEIELGMLVDDAVPVAIRGDETRLKQVVINLLSNAVKFTERGEVVLMATARVRDVGDSPSHELEVSVRDTGIGIRSDRLQMIFESFTQADSSTTRRYGGSGLGLAICSRLVKLMGGQIGVDSEHGRGSTFYFTVPVHADPAPGGPRVEAEHPLLSGQRVLVVADNATGRELLVQRLSGWGMVPEAVESGGQALERLRGDGRFSFVILDVPMRPAVASGAPAVASGAPALARQIHQVRAELPLILLMSMGRRLANEHSSLFAAFVTKPVKSSSLYDVIVHVLSGGSTSGIDDILPAPTSFDEQLASRLPLSILVAEDNPVNQQLAEAVLRKMGYRVDIVGDGAEVIEVVQRRSYDVVLMDMHMPKIDGLDATRRIRGELASDRQPHIIAVTASATTQDRLKCMDAGMNDYLSKPFRSKELVAALERVRGPGAASGVEATPTPASRIETEAIDHLCVVFGDESSTRVPALIGDFIEDSTRLVTEIEDCLEQGDVRTLNYDAHTLRSTAATMGASSLSGAARALEHRTEDGTLDGVAPYVTELRARLTEATEALEQIRATF